jgi:hypothetical protein
MIDVLPQLISYRRFLEAKCAFDQTYGFDVNPTYLHPILKPHQRDKKVA